MGFEISTSGADLAIFFLKLRLKCHENENRPNISALTVIPWSKILQKLATWKKWSNAELLSQNYFFVLGNEKLPKKAWRKEVHLAAIFHCILNLNLLSDVIHFKEMYLKVTSDNSTKFLSPCSHFVVVLCICFDKQPEAFLDSWYL